MLRKYKHYLIGFLAGTLLFSLSPVFAEGELNVIENLFPVYINGKMERVEGYNINGYTYLKLSDLSKAGLEVRFNEVKKRIEIESAVNVLNKIEKDGYELVVSNGVEYVSIDDIVKKYEDKYRFDKIDDRFAAYRNSLALVNNETNLRIIEIPNKNTLTVNDKTYIEYNYFIRRVQGQMEKEPRMVRP
jgi:hypothetical protein